MMSMLKRHRESFNGLLALSFAIHLIILSGVILLRNSNQVSLPQLEGITVEINSIDFPAQEVKHKSSVPATARPAIKEKVNVVATPVLQTETANPAMQAEMTVPVQAKISLPATPPAAKAQTPATQPQPQNHKTAAAADNAAAVITQADSINREYGARVRELIDRQKEYPLMARRSGVEGTVYIKFVIGRDGSLKKAEVSRSSGRRILDRAAINAVSAVRRFPAVPASMEGPELNFELPLTYKIAGH